MYINILLGPRTTDSLLWMRLYTIQDPGNVLNVTTARSTSTYTESGMLKSLACLIKNETRLCLKSCEDYWKQVLASRGQLMSQLHVYVQLHTHTGIMFNNIYYSLLW
jgi:hypothetical protein